jgi:hypothetical protein
MITTERCIQEGLKFVITKTITVMASQMRMVPRGAPITSSMATAMVWGTHLSRLVSVKRWHRGTPWRVGTAMITTSTFAQVV